VKDDYETGRTRHFDDNGRSGWRGAEQGRGWLYGWPPLARMCLLVEEGSPQGKSTEISLKDLKAVFFVKDFKGNSKYKESQKIEDGKAGRKIEIRFFDGEKIVGTTQAYNPNHKGFFVFPADAKSNSLRVFVVNWNVKDVKFL
jgi:hypothetical protein